jgi:arginyl-tRNA synthetase
MEANVNRVVKTNIVNDEAYTSASRCWHGQVGQRRHTQSTGKKGDTSSATTTWLSTSTTARRLAQLKAQYTARAWTRHRPREGQAEAPLIKEAHDMLVKWEHGDKEVRDCGKR